MRLQPEDHKLDNKRVPCKVKILTLRYELGLEVTRTVSRHFTMSGYCFDALKPDLPTIGFDIIGKIVHGETRQIKTGIRRKFWQISMFPEDEVEAKKLFFGALGEFKRAMIYFYNQIPDK